MTQSDHQEALDSAPPLEVHDLAVSYYRKPVLYGVDVVIPRGALVGIIGPNGAGKSTLIKAALGVVPVVNGWVRVFGKPIKKVRGRIAYVPQRESVDWDFPVTVEDVVMMGRYGSLGLLRRPGAADRERVAECLDRVGMPELAGRRISDLSGGQQQRVFLARALAQDSDLYFMDEPFAGVDAATEARMIELMGKLRDAGKTLIVVHHDLITARRYFDYLLLLNMRVVAFGPTEEVYTAEKLQAAYGGRLTILSDVVGAAERRRREGRT